MHLNFWIKYVDIDGNQRVMHGGREEMDGFIFYSASFFSKIVDKIIKLKYNGETQRQQYIAPKKDRL